MNIVEITKHQLGITEKVTQSSLFLSFEIKDHSMLQFGLRVLQKFVDGRSVVAGFGKDLLKLFSIPSSGDFERARFDSDRISDCDGYDLVLWLRGNDNGEIFHQAINIAQLSEHI